MSSTFPLADRSRRTNFWEAIYEPSLAKLFTVGDWKLEDLGANLKLFRAGDLRRNFQEKKVALKFTGVRFVDCDFTGFFTKFGRAIIFKECEFRRCDFGLSTWERAKFTSCNFSSCSITQSTWTDCEFRKCDWNNISMAGNETNFIRVYIDNPEQFVGSAYTNLNEAELEAQKISAHFQRTRLEETRATVARNLYHSHRIVGDDATFHKVCKVFTLQGIVARRSEIRYRRSSVKKLLDRTMLALRDWVCSFELYITKLFGLANGWGASLSRPLGMLALTLFAFTFFNRLFFDANFAHAFMRAFDATSVAGYTKATSSDASFWVQAVVAFNLTLALFFYTVFFSTAVAKVSRFR